MFGLPVHSPWSIFTQEYIELLRIAISISKRTLDFSSISATLALAPGLPDMTAAIAITVDGAGHCFDSALHEGDQISHDTNGLLVLHHLVVVLCFQAGIVLLQCLYFVHVD